MSSGIKNEPASQNATRPLPGKKSQPGNIPWQKVLFWHSSAFFVIIVMTWCEEAFYFLHQLFRQVPQEPNFVGAGINTLVIILVWVASGLGIYRLTARLNYLERFLHVCAWCRKLEDDGNWVTFEAHFSKQEGHKVSHGICPECSKKLEEES